MEGLFDDILQRLASGEVVHLEQLHTVSGRKFARKTCGTVDVDLHDNAVNIGDDAEAAKPLGYLRWGDGWKRVCAGTSGGGGDGVCLP